jgi:hypothetical protein
MTQCGLLPRLPLETFQSRKILTPDRQVLFDVVTRSGIAVGLEGNIVRLPLGSDCVERWKKKVKGMGENLDAVRGFVRGLDLKDRIHSRAFDYAYWKINMFRTSLERA